MGSFQRVQVKVNFSPNLLIVASALVSATQCMKTLYHSATIHMSSFCMFEIRVNSNPHNNTISIFFYFQSIAGVVISLLVASTLVSATQCMKALYHGGLELRNESCTICVKVARYNPPKNHQNMPENANDKAAFPLPAIQQTGNRTKNVRKVFI